VPSGMNDPAFFKQMGPFTVAELAEASGAEVARAGPDGLAIDRVSTLEEAGPGAVAFFDNKRYADQLSACTASAFVTQKRHLAACPENAAVLIARDPGTALGQITRLFFPEADKPIPFWSQQGSAAAHIDPTARLEADVTIEPGAVIGAGVVIGANTTIGAGAAIGRGCMVGRNCSFGPGVSVQHALIGDGVILHPGVRIGQDGFGYASGPEGHTKIPQIGRVILQDNVEIGANSCVDRGGLRDTTIGEGTKIDNLVQIGHNVQTGRHCMIVAGVSLAGSVILGDFVAIGGHTVVDNHVQVGSGAQIAGISVVNRDVPPGERWGGTPAQPAKQWMRDLLSMRRLARQEQAERTGGNTGEEDQ
jgi:UDP-3-O-[3-hydroxymyristoyl] glucosamine N-acyltransferase